MQQINMRRKEIVTNIIILVIASLVCFVILEIIFRNIFGLGIIMDSEGNTAFIPDNELGFVFKQNFSGYLKDRGFNTKFNTNAQGFRGENFDPFYEKIIFMLGDSMTLGYGIDENQTSSYMLQKYLNDRYKVYNLGVLHYGQKQEVVQLKRYLPIYKPDLVIVNLALANDIMDNCEPIPYLNSTAQSKSIRDIIKKSRFIVFLYRSIILPFKEPLDLDFYIQSPEKEECYAKTEKYLSEMKNLSLQYNSTMVLVIIGREYHTSEKEKKRLLDRYERFQDYNENKEKFDLYIGEKKVNEMCSSLDINCLDLIPIFKEYGENTPFYLSDDVHWSKEGSDLAAREIEKYLKKNWLA